MNGRCLVRTPTYDSLGRRAEGKSCSTFIQINNRESTEFYGGSSFREA
jgi:hypothetical protein